MPVSSLGYLHLDVTDLDAWEVFAAEFLGVMPAGGDATSRRYRIDHHPARLVTHAAPQPGARALGFEVVDRAELRALVAAVNAAGYRAKFADAETCSARRVTGMAHVVGPGDAPIELFYGPVLDHVTVNTPLVSGFVTGSQGFGHVIITVPDVDEGYRFFTEVLGFWERNSMRTPGGELFFLACNDRHHTLGIMPADGPSRLVHLMLEAATLDDVGRAIDRGERLGVPFQQSLGRHTNDHMVSFYVYSPERYAVELGWGGLRIPAQGPTYEITQGAFWGHKFTPPPEAV